MVQATSLDLKLLPLTDDGNKFPHIYAQKHSLKDLFEKLNVCHVDQQNERGHNLYDLVREESTDNWLIRCFLTQNNQGYTFLATALNNIENEDAKKNEQVIMQREEDLVRAMELMALIFGEEMITKMCEKADNNGNSLAHLAVLNSLTKLGAFILLKAEKTHKIFNKDGYNPLQLAVQMNRINMVKQILKQKPESVNICRSNKETALHIAAQSGCCEVLSELIKYLGNLTQQNEDGHTPLHACLEPGLF